MNKQQNTQQPVAWVVYNGWRKELPFLTEEAASDFVAAEQLHSDLSGSLAAYRVIPTYTAPPVPRDVLMAAMRDAVADLKAGAFLADCGTDIAFRAVDYSAIADRYASQVLPERCQCCGYLVTESEHKGCLRAGRAANAPEPVNQQMRDALEAIAVAEIFDPLASAVAMQTMARGTLNAIAAAEAAQPDHIVDTDKMVHAVPDVLEQLQLAETEVINAKAWSVGEEAKKHCKYALTAIAVARAMLSASQKPDGVE